MPDPDFPLRSVLRFYPRGPHPVFYEGVCKESEFLVDNSSLTDVTVT